MLASALVNASIMPRGGVPTRQKGVCTGLPFIGFVSFYSTVDEVWNLHQEIEVKYYSLGLNSFCFISL